MGAFSRDFRHFLPGFLFGEILRLGLGTALALFVAIELSLALLSLHLFRGEHTGGIHVTGATDPQRAALRDPS